jgi:hypothetical protein
MTEETMTRGAQMSIPAIRRLQYGSEPMQNWRQGRGACSSAAIEP